MGLFRRRKRSQEVEPTPAPAPPERESPLAAFDALLEREVHRLAAPGTWWTGGERVAIAADARAFRRGDAASGILPPPVAEATELVAVAPATIRPAHLERWAAQGLDPLSYVELVGIVSRITALDVAAFGIGRRPATLRDPLPGDPGRVPAEGAEVTTGWVPTVGPASAPSSLSAVPAEKEAMFDLHGMLYLPLEEMLDVGAARDGLTRPQLELVAARTSALNECFY
jgi:hypothetical protein